MRKEFLLTLITIALISSFLLGCSQNQEKKINEITNIKLSDVTKIVFFDGRGRNKPYTLEDKQKIIEFMGVIDNYVLKIERNHKDFSGWTRLDPSILDNYPS